MELEDTFPQIIYITLPHTELLLDHLYYIPSCQSSVALCSSHEDTMQTLLIPQPV